MRIKLTILFLVAFLYSSESFAQGTWSSLGKGIPLKGQGVVAICADTINNILYAGGEFDSAGDIKQRALAKWDGTNWDTTVFISSWISVYTLIMYQGDLIVGFSDGSVGKYDGSKMTYLPSLNKAADCFYIYNDTLYAGGSFTKSGSTKLNCIAKFNGTKWQPVGKGFRWNNCCPYISSLTEYKGNLIAAGAFDTAGSVVVTSIASYDGFNWSSMGFTMSDLGAIPFISSMEVYDNKLYVLGSFNSLDSIFTTCTVINWDGVSADTMFSGTGNSAAIPPAGDTLKTFDGFLFSSGMFNGEIPYKYNGDSISTVDSGISGNIYRMTSWEGSLYVVGAFHWAIEEKTKTPCIARWTPDSVTTSIKQLSNINQISVYPNPFSASTTIKFSQPVNANSQLALFDLTGRQVGNYYIPNNTKSFIIKRNDLPGGMYFYKLFSGGVQIVAGKLIVE